MNKLEELENDNDTKLDVVESKKCVIKWLEAYTIYVVSYVPYNIKLAAVERGQGGFGSSFVMFLVAYWIVINS